MADGGNEAVFTVKEWLNRIDSKQDRLEEKIDKVAEAMDRKADAHDLRDLQDRVTIMEQQEAARVNIYNRLQGQVDSNSVKIDEKAEKASLESLQKLLVGALSGSAIAILAWALTLVVR